MFRGFFFGALVLLGHAADGAAFEEALEVRQAIAD
jgi:hypothetical protein